MKVTVVPAQVTTVEDRIIGSLGFSQMLLLIVPVFVGAGLFALLPPVMESSVYKFTIMGLLAIVCCVLSIRIKGKVLVFWIITVLRYNLRPKYYVFNKNTAVHRETYTSRSTDTEPQPVPTATKRLSSTSRIELRDAVRVLATIDNPAAKLRFETTRKGGLHVRLTEIEE